MIKLENITKEYKSKTRQKTALNKVNCSFPNKGLCLIKGESGSGKSTLIKIIDGRIKQTSGTIAFSGINENDTKNFQRDNISYIDQEINLDQDLTVQQNLKDIANLTNRKYRESDIDEFLIKYNLLALRDVKVKKLSGGEKQRVNVIKEIIVNKQIIIADEPTSNLDEENSKVIIETLKELAKDHLVILVSHNEEETKELTDLIYYIKDGELNYGHEINDKTKFTYEKINSVTPYTKIYRELNLKKPSTYIFLICFIIIFFLFLITAPFVFYNSEFAYNKYVNKYNEQNGTFYIKNEPTDLADNEKIKFNKETYTFFQNNYESENYLVVGDYGINYLSNGIDNFRLNTIGFVDVKNREKKNVFNYKVNKKKTYALENEALVSIELWEKLKREYKGSEYKLKIVRGGSEIKEVEEITVIGYYEQLIDPYTFNIFSDGEGITPNLLVYKDLKNSEFFDTNDEKGLNIYGLTTNKLKYKEIKRIIDKHNETIKIEYYKLNYHNHGYKAVNFGDSNFANPMVGLSEMGIVVIVLVCITIFFLMWLYPFLRARAKKERLNYLIKSKFKMSYIIISELLSNLIVILTALGLAYGLLEISKPGLLLASKESRYDQIICYEPLNIFYTDMSLDFILTIIFVLVLTGLTVSEILIRKRKIKNL